MNTDTTTQFQGELDSFFFLALLNMAFGALAMAFGMQYILLAVLGQPIVQTGPVLRILGGAISLAGFGLGLSWILTSARVLRGIREIRKEYRHYEGPVPGEVLTGWIVRMLAHYRENKRILPWMITVSRLGGCCFVTLGIVNILQGTAALASGTGGMDPALCFIAAAINLTIGAATIAISIGFHRYARAWDCRLEATAKNESILESALERQ
jgi:hypothetical protein